MMLLLTSTTVPISESLSLPINLSGFLKTLAPISAVVNTEPGFLITELLLELSLITVSHSNCDFTS